MVHRYDAAQTKYAETAQLFMQEMTHIQHMLIMAVLYAKSCGECKSHQNECLSRQPARPRPCIN